MKKRLLAVGLALGISLPMAANAAEYKIDTKGAHASVNFKVSHLGFSYTVGRFDKFNGEFNYDPKNIEASSVTVTVDTSSVDSNHAERDKHIRSDDFLDVSKYPKAKFVSTKVVDKGNGLFDIIGDLTLHGKTKQITIKDSLLRKPTKFFSRKSYGSKISQNFAKLYVSSPELI